MFSWIFIILIYILHVETVLLRSESDHFKLNEGEREEERGREGEGKKNKIGSLLAAEWQKQTVQAWIALHVDSDR